MGLQADTLSARSATDGSFAGDSLGSAFFPDSLGLQGPFTADTLTTDTLIPTQAHDIFGHGSVLHEGAAGDVLQGSALSGWFPFQLTVLCLLAVYLILALKYGGRVLSSLRSAGEGEGESYHFMFSGPVKALWVTGCFILGLGAAKASEIWIENAQASSYPQYFSLAVTASVAVAVIAISFLQRMILRAVGGLTINGDFFRRLLSVRRSFFAASTVICSPFILLAGLAPERAAAALLCVALAAAALITLYFLYCTLRLFFEQKVSILFWFLYLCAVEVLPYAIPVTAMLRYLQI